MEERLDTQTKDFQVINRINTLTYLRRTFSEKEIILGTSAGGSWAEPTWLLKLRKSRTHKHTSAA